MDWIYIIFEGETKPLLKSLSDTSIEFEIKSECQKSQQKLEKKTTSYFDNIME